MYVLFSLIKSIEYWLELDTYFVCNGVIAYQGKFMWFYYQCAVSGFKFVVIWFNIFVVSLVVIAFVFTIPAK